MKAEAPAASTAPALRFRRGAGRVAAAAAALEQVPLRYVLGALVAAQWIAVLALARTVTHNGWIYYQGGDQLWYYTTGWLVVHGHMPYALVGYGWSLLMAPFALVFGPNVADALPAIIALQFVILLPVALLAMYGIGSLIGGRLAGYWVALLWIVVPFAGILYTNAGYHERYTEVTLPQGFGLTGMADFASMVLLVVSTYLFLRVLAGAGWEDAVLAGLVAGLAIAAKPSNAFYLAGVVLAFAWVRRRLPVLLYGAGLAPSLLVLALWKWRGYGYVPVLHAAGGVRSAAGAALAAPPLGGLDLHYLNPDWHRLSVQIGQLREHFWSARLVEWTTIAGSLALLRRSRPIGLLVAGWFFSYAIFKTASAEGSIDDSSLLRLLLPAAPAFVLTIAAIPLLLPRLPGRLRPDAPAAWGSPRLRRGVIAACAVVFVLVPFGLTAAASPLRETQDLAFTVDGNMPVPVDPGFRATASVANGVVHLAWPEQKPLGGTMFYRVLRSRAGHPPTCTRAVPRGAATCALDMPVARYTFATSARDRPASGRWTYRIAAAANWQNNIRGGDAYILSRALTVTIP